ncbi:hypothetical protein DH86_00004345, partial [Scytalidium sp. 3C]
EAVAALGGVVSKRVVPPLTANLVVLFLVPSFAMIKPAMLSGRKALKYASAFAGLLLLLVFLRENVLISTGDRAIAHRRISMTEPKSTHRLWRPHDYQKDNDKLAPSRVNASLISLVRNSELEGIIDSMRQVEAVWNSKFNYPWTFFNDHWDVPEWIDEEKFKAAAQVMKAKLVKYASKMSYHQMCRWFSGFFYKHPALKDFRYYWRVEPNIKLFCDIDYDVFRYMQDNNKTYGFTINIYDDPNTIPSLWPETLKFIAEHPEAVSPRNSMDWLTDSSLRPDVNMKANGYSTCHFWSNFEIGDLDFWRSPAYEAYFEHLDRAGGFFYERWGDAPVHSVALGLFEETSKIHWFRDIGYQHTVFSNCPDSPKCRGCRPNRLAPLAFWLNKEDCRVNWFNQVCKYHENRDSDFCL